MSILSEIGSLFHTGTATEAEDKLKGQAAWQTNVESDGKQETSYTSKQSAEAITNNALADINAKPETRVKTCNTKKLTGKLFPDFDQRQITQDYLALREEAKQKAVRTTKRIYRTFTTGDMSDLTDKNGNIIATFTIPEKHSDNFTDGDEFCSYKMTEYSPKTGEVVAVTRVFNHDGFNKQWKRHYGPYMERFEFGKKPEDTTYLKIGLTRKEKDGKYILHPEVQLYAKGYQSDGLVTGMRKADKFISSLIHQDYESYRTNYEAPTRIFDGCLYSDPASVTEKDGMYGEKFDSALEYPTRQFKIGDEIYVFNPYYVNEKGNRTED